MSTGGLQEIIDNTRKIEDKVVFSNRSSEKAAAVIVSDGGVTIVSRGVATGIHVGESGVTIQGDLLITGNGTSIKKGNYSENPKSAKLFTYSETVQFEGIIKDKISKAAGKAGVNTGDLLTSAGLGSWSELTDEVSKGGAFPLLTNVGGYPPHIHTMMFKHVHQLEPSYLYRVPGILKMFTGALKPLLSFFQTFGS